ncbi:GNAT family N-acetyltransferase [Halogranum rubrum]|uniref:N-acetyltransferase domain-containing protein n=1 Tax=Halogranum salarium B-1 TaxID=1210908 RepID=J3JFK1_9EURY|nr:GNAT family protein [Halogranum salarium]EJN59324.1 hypothetical protein HSB1_27450 [Halogranum salarium B-1]
MTTDTRSLFPFAIETDRLRLQRCTTVLDPRDAYEYWGESDTIEEETRFLGWGRHATPKASHDALDSFQRGWDDGSKAIYAMTPHDGEPDAGEFAGTAMLFPDWESQSASLGIWLRKRFWGRGYAGERAAALLQLVFDRLDLDIVVVEHEPDNDQSRRAIEKYVERYGGRFDGTLRNWMTGDDGPVDICRYSISHAEWRDAVGDEREATFVEMAQSDCENSQKRAHE